MSQPYISILIAVYNGSAFLKTCLASISKQDFPDSIEIIIVDDGSTDESPDIIRAYAQHDTRVQIIRHDANQGLGATRNTGIAAATGRYICFVDADDYLDPEYCAKLFNKAQETDADIVLCAYQVHTPDRMAQPALVDYTAFGPTRKQDLIQGIINGSISGFSWNKLYLKSFLEMHRLRFMPRSVLEHGEDRLFSVQCLSLSGRIAFVHQPLYHYIIREASMSISYRPTLFNDILAIDRIYAGFFRRHSILHDYQKLSNQAILKGVVSCAYNELKNGKTGMKKYRHLKEISGHPRVSHALSEKAYQHLSVKDKWILFFTKYKLTVPLHYLLQLKKHAIPAG